MWKIMIKCDRNRNSDNKFPYLWRTSLIIEFLQLVLLCMSVFYLSSVSSSPSLAKTSSRNLSDEKVDYNYRIKDKINTSSGITTTSIRKSREAISAKTWDNNYNCEIISIPICLEMNYNETSYPNLLGHSNQKEASYEIHKFYTLIKIHCSSKLRLLLCSLFAPVCDSTSSGSNINEVLAPCQSLCEKVRGDCSESMLAFGLSWPENIECSRFPNEKNEICFQGKDGETPQELLLLSKSKKIDSLNNKNYSSYSSTENQPNPFSLSPRDIESSAGTGDQRKIFYPNIKSKGNYNGDDLKCPSNWHHHQGGHYIGEIVNCSAPCGHFNSIFSAEKKFIATILISIFSFASLISSLCTILTVLFDPKRFHYPEKCIVHLAFCYFCISIGYIISAFFGSDINCHKGFIVQGPAGDQASCTLIFMLVYFFTISAHIWWFVMSFQFYLSAHLKWAEESIGNYKLYYHCLAWGVPFFTTILSIALGRSPEGDLLLVGPCTFSLARPTQLRYFMIYPLLSLLTVGIFFFARGFCALVLIRKEIKKNLQTTNQSLMRGADLNLNGSTILGSTINEGSRRLEYFMVRIAIFSILYIASTIIFILTLSYISMTSEIITEINNGQSDNFYIVLLFRYVSNLIFGCALSIWIFNRKSYYIWKSVFRINSSTNTHSTPQNNLK